MPWRSFCGITVPFAQCCVRATLRIVTHLHPVDDRRRAVAECALVSPDRLTASASHNNRRRSRQPLPAGCDEAEAMKDIWVVGGATAAKEFSGCSDCVRYVVDLGAAKGPFTLTAELLCQSIGYRWAQNLKQYNSAETALFFGSYASMPNIPATLASTQAETK